MPETGNKGDNQKPQQIEPRISSMLELISFSGSPELLCLGRFSKADLETGTKTKKRKITLSFGKRIRVPRKANTLKSAWNSFGGYHSAPLRPPRTKTRAFPRCFWHRMPISLFGALWGAWQENA
jgi:hypothetical protein